ncbi:hypothetical protein J6590_089656 [Homalodisca vitripennis]|nr:hypothetical protein J6590_089656 [Homalodisca vitripennis]
MAGHRTCSGHTCQRPQTEFSATMWSDCTLCIVFSVYGWPPYLLWSHVSGTRLLKRSNCVWLATVPSLVKCVRNQTDFSATMWSDCTLCIVFSVHGWPPYLLWSHVSGTRLTSAQHSGQTLHSVVSYGNEALCSVESLQARSCLRYREDKTGRNRNRQRDNQTDRRNFGFPSPTTVRPY